MSDTEDTGLTSTAQADLYPPSPQDLSAAHPPVEEEEVTYDEDHDDDQEADGHPVLVSGDVDRQTMPRVIRIAWLSRGFQHPNQSENMRE